MTVTQSILARAGKIAGTTLDIQRKELINAETAAVLMRVGPNVRTSHDLDVAVASAFKNTVRVMDKSAFRPVRNNPGLVCAVLTAVKEKRPATETASFDGLTTMSANIFRDPDNQIWQKVGEGDAAMLVKKTNDDLASLLKARESLTVETATVGVNVSEPCVAGQLIGWYDITAERQRFGICTASTNTAVAGFDLDTRTMFAFSPSAVNVAASEKALDETEVAGLAPSSFSPGVPLSANNMISRHLDYMAILYGKNGTYYKKLLDLIRTAYGESVVL